MREAGFALGYGAVHRQPVAGAQFDQVAAAQVAGGDGFDGAILAEAAGAGFGEALQGADGFAGAEQAAFLQHMPQDHDDGQDGGGHQVAAGPGADQSERDQAVGDAVQAGVAQAVPGGHEDGGRDQRGGGAGDELCDRRFAGERPLPDYGEQQEAGGEGGQGEADCQQKAFAAGEQAGKGLRRSRPAGGDGGGAHFCAPERIRWLTLLGSTALSPPACCSTAAMRSR